MICLVTFSYAQSSCYSELKGDTLTIGNRLVERKFVWNGGNLMTYSLCDKVNGKIRNGWNLPGGKGDGY